MGEPAMNRDVAIVGLGYVGLTLGTVLADAGYSVLGVEKRADVVDQTNQGIPHFSEVGLADALTRVTTSGKLLAAEQFDDSVSCDTYIITVGTPLSSDGVARIDMIEHATREVAANMRDGALVILRSTVKVGTTRNVVSPDPGSHRQALRHRHVPGTHSGGPRPAGTAGAAADHRRRRSCGRRSRRIGVPPADQFGRQGVESGERGDRQARRQHLPRRAIRVRQRSRSALRCVRRQRARGDLVGQARILAHQRPAAGPGRRPVPGEGSPHPDAERSDSRDRPGDHRREPTGQRAPTHRDGRVHQQ